jgi:hypothetical protein
MGIMEAQDRTAYLVNMKRRPEIWALDNPIRLSGEFLEPGKSCARE